MVPSLECYNYAFDESEMKNILKNKIKSSIELCSYGASSEGQIKSRYQTHNKGTFARGKNMMEFDVTVKIRCYVLQ